MAGEAGTLLNGDNMHINDVLTLFLRAGSSALLSPKTLDWYEYELRQFFKWLEQQPYRNGNWLQPYVIEEYLDAGRQRGLAPATVAGKHRALRGFFAWLVKRGHIKESPMNEVLIPHVPKKEPRRTELHEYLRLIESIPQKSWIDLRDRLIINILFLCGLRLDECASLELEDFRLSESVLVVRNAKGGDHRPVPLLPAVAKAFVAYVYARPAPHAKGEHLLFLGSDGGGNAEQTLLPGGIRQMLRRRCKRAGVRNLNPHAFRHGLAVYLLNQGGDMSLVQKILGHSRISTTADHYAAWLTEGVIKQYADKMKNVEDSE